MFDILAPAHYTLNLYVVPPFLTSLAIMLLGVVVAVRERGSAVGWSFLWMTLSIGSWLFAISVASFAKSPTTALWWDKAVYAGVPLIPAAIYQFTTIILRITEERRWVVRLNWVLGVVAVVICLTSDALLNDVYHYSWGYYPKFRWFGAPFLVWWVASMLVSLVEYYLAYRRRAHGATYQRRVRAFLIAFLVGYVGAIDYFPTYGIPIYPTGFVFIVIFVALIARTIWLYRLVDITPAFAAPQLIQTMSDALIVLDSEGIIRLVNPATSALLGTCAQGLIGQHAAQTVGGPFVSLVIAALFSGETVKDREIVFESARSAPARRILSVSASVLRDHKQQAVGVVCVARDVTERVSQADQIREQASQLQVANEELRRTQAQVIEQERLYALGTMASGIAHDFNNALTPILGYSELLLKQTNPSPDPELLQECLSLINEGALDCAQVLSRLRDFYRPTNDDSEMIAVDLNDLVDRTIALTRPRWHDQTLVDGRVIAIERDLKPVPLIAGHPGELREVLTNLIFNAVDALPRGGRITVRTASVGDRVVLDVEDTGMGMPEPVRQRCFEPFFTTKGEKGSGLGLSVVYGSVRRHGGKVEIASVEGKGTTFHITLPVLEGPMIATKPAAAPAGQLRILLVDDETRVRVVVSRLLSMSGHHCVDVASGKEAIEAFAGEQFDVVITDRALPEMSGDRIARAIKVRSPSTPVVMLTGFGGMMSRAEEIPLGVDLVLAKPVTLKALEEGLSQVVAKRAEASARQG